MKNPKGSTFRLDFRILSILLLVAVIPLLVGSWWLFRGYENAYLELAGNDLSQAADTAVGVVNSYLSNQIIQTAGLTESPVLRAAVARSNQDLGGDLDSVKQELLKLEGEWVKLEAEDIRLRGILDNSASQFLRQYAKTVPAYREILVTDFLGRLVAASQKTSNYYQAVEPWWQETFADGRRGSVFIGDITFDDSAKTWALELAQPFVDPEREVVTGVIKVVLGAETIHSLIGSFQAGVSGNAVLLREDGEIISALGYELMAHTTYPDAAEILNARDKGWKYFVSAASEPSVYGLAQANLQPQYPHLKWIVVTTSPAEDALGPLMHMRRYFAFMVVAVILIGVIAALLISRVESRPAIIEDAHLEKL